MITRDQALDNIDAKFTDGLVRQGVWNKTEDGRHLACFLGAADPSVYGIKSCPANLAPSWVLQTIPSMFDDMSTAVALKPETGFRMTRAWRKMTGEDDLRWDIVKKRWLVFFGAASA